MHRSLLAAALLAAPATPALSQAPSPSATQIADLEARIAALTARLSQMESREALGAAAAPTADSGAASPQGAQSQGSRGATSGSGAAEGDDDSAGEPPPGPASRALAALGAEAELLAAADSSRVSFKLTREVSATRPGRQADVTGRATRWSATASAPVSKGGTRTDLGTQDGFASDFQFKLGLGQYKRPLLNPLLDRRLQELQSRALKACLAAKTQAECDAEPKGDTFVTTYVGVDAGKEYLRRSIPGRGGFAFGGEVSVGYLKHNYVDLASVASASETDVPWGAKLYYAPFVRPASLLLFSVQHVESRKDQDEGVLCPVPTGAPVACLRGALGAPKQQQKLLWGAEYRRLFEIPAAAGATPLIRSVGIAPQLLHDSRNDVTSLDLPIYLVPSEKSEFIGGVRFGWDTENHDVVAGVFVGRAFGLRP